MGRKAGRQRDRRSWMLFKQTDMQAQGQARPRCEGPEGSEAPSWLHAGPCRDLRGKWGQIATEELKEIA